MTFRRFMMVYPAALGRLCVETFSGNSSQAKIFGQPPSGGCVLKHLTCHQTVQAICQPPSGGCVLKHRLNRQLYPNRINQPPSGGCVLKHHIKIGYR